METSPLLLLLLLVVGIVLLSEPLVCFGQPISFPSSITFNSSTERRTLGYEDSGGGLFFWPLHQEPAISNLSFFSTDATPMWYHSVCAAYLGYVSNTTSEVAYVLSVVITGVEDGPHPENGMIVWMANRDKLARGIGPTLSIESNGHLVLRGGNGEIVWQTDVAGNQLELQGDGNLLLFDDSKNVVWQSFDHPGDTLTLGQVLGQGTRLMSRASTMDFTWGSYSLVLDNDLRFSFYYSQDGNPNSVRYTQTGTSTNLLVPCQPGLMGCAMVDFSLALSVSVYCDTKCSNNQSAKSWAMNSTSPMNSTPLPMSSLSNETIPILRLLYNGDFVIYQCGRLSIWSPPQSFFAAEGMAACQLPTRCNRYTTCFPANNTCSSGCTTETGQSCMIGNEVPRPTCKKPNGWEMGTIAGRTYISNQYDTPISVSNSQQCKDLCYQNCSCTASFYNPAPGSCYLITERLLHLTHNFNSSYMAFIKIPPSSSSDSGSMRSSLIAIIVVLATLMVVATIIVALVVIRKRHIRRSNDTKKKLMPNIEEKPDPNDDFLHESLHTITRYSYQQIISMTSGFITKVGSGGFGPVYEGLLPNGNKVAVKKLDAMSGQGSKEFRAEVAIMAGIHHRNLVDLLGFCADGLNKVLVYEHMSKGSLDRWLFHSQEELVLTWARRFKIAIGVANGLAYLHEGCTKKIIHLDVKPQNILLDENFKAKVGDFGLSRLLSQEESFAMTTMRGTPGYMAPEWLQEGGVTEKIDIYSFGMVLLELVSGRKNLIMQLEDLEKRYFPSWAFDKLKEGKDMELLDPMLVGQVVPKHKEDVKQGHVQDHDDDEVLQFKRTVHVAFVCIQEDPHCRPRMSSVAKMLEGEEMLPPLPLDHEIHRYLQSRSKSPSSSKNCDNLFDTTMVAR